MDHGCKGERGGAMAPARASGTALPTNPVSARLCKWVGSFRCVRDAKSHFDFLARNLLVGLLAL